jgi:haloalkane dehalogenase
MRAAGLSYREAGAGAARTVLLVHGYPESSYMWRHVLPELEAIGWRAVAPDLAGFGDSEVDRPGTWERHIDSLDRFVGELGLNPVVLVTHDWGVLVGLRWACDHPDSVQALVISDGAFFADRRWHDLANVMRTPEEGERAIRAFTREGFGSMLGSLSTGMTEDAVDEYWKGFASDEHRLAHLDMYRSGDFEKLAAYDGAVARLGVPTLILWGGHDRFSSPRMAHRYNAEIPGSQVVVLDEVGHFIWEDAPAEATEALTSFLAEL